MKNILSAILLLIAGSGFLMAQRLSPNTYTFLTEKNKNIDRLKSATAQSGMVKAFVEINDRKGIDKLEQLGAEIYVDGGDKLTASLPINKLYEIGNLPEVDRVQVASKVRTMMDNARADANVDLVQKGDATISPYTGKGVVIGIVDTGFDYGHIAFYTSDQSELRVKRVWDQNSVTGTRPSEFNYGAEYATESAILSARYDNTTEYHATHVSGIAAGADLSSPYYGVAPDAELVFVSFGNNDVDITNAVQYVFEYAESVGKPCVVSLSLGSHYGPHDGTSTIDRMFDELAGPGRIIVGSAGNEGEYKLHAKKTFTSDDNEFKSVIGYESERDKSAVIDIWGSEGSEFTVKAVVVDVLRNNRIIYSTDEISSSDMNGTHEFTFNIATHGLSGTVYIAADPYTQNGRPNVYMQSSVTQSTSARSLAIVVTGQDGQTVDLWNAAYGDFTSGGKAGWDDGDNNSTIGEIGGTGKSTITVGSYDTKHTFKILNDPNEYQLGGLADEIGDLSPYSSHGPTLDGRMKPDVTAPGAIIISAGSRYGLSESLKASTSYITTKDGESYYYIYSAGTSMSSPFITGTIALWLEANPELSPDDIREILSESSRHDDATGTTPDNLWGYGKVDAYAGLVSALNKMNPGEGGITDNVADASDLRVASTDGSLQFFFPKSKNGIQASIYDITGKQVASHHVANPGDKISTSDLAKGIYIVTMQQNGAQHTAKVAVR